MTGCKIVTYRMRSERVQNDGEMERTEHFKLRLTPENTRALNLISSLLDIFPSALRNDSHSSIVTGACRGRVGGQGGSLPCIREEREGRKIEGGRRSMEEHG